MKTIYKYTIPADNTVTAIQMPVGAKILHADRQRDAFCVWAEVEPDVNGVETRYVILVGTGWSIPSEGDARHINSFMMDGGTYVFHAYELTGKP